MEGLDEEATKIETVLGSADAGEAQPRAARGMQRPPTSASQVLHRPVRPPDIRIPSLSCDLLKAVCRSSRYPGMPWLQWIETTQSQTLSMIED